VPFLALTASATPRVQEDIVTQLELEKPVVFRQSFARKNIAYMVFETEDKRFRMEQILKKYPQPSIIYVRNRKSCLDVSAQMNAAGLKATYYHGGLPIKEKDKNMQLWMNEEVQVIVATNAFGMGIDKANVKTVIHIQLPENLENYYQEAGRAGRNEERAFAVVLSSPSDMIQAENQFINSLPDKKFLTEVYIKLCNYFRIAYGEGINEQFSFNLNQFCQKYHFPAVKTFNAIQFLDRQGIISLSQEFSEKITIQFLIESKEVIRYISLNPNDEEIILSILRTYPGIYDMRTAFNLPLISKKSNSSEAQVNAVLQKLKQKEIIDFHALNNDATLIFNEVREDERTINRISKFLENQNQLKKSQLRSVLEYVNDHNNCKSRQILNYFGESEAIDCGICSNCIKKQKPVDATDLPDKILALLKMQDFDSRELEKLTRFPSSDVIFVLQYLLENELISIHPNNLYTIKK